MDGQPRWLSSCQCLPTWTQSLGDFLGWCHPPDHSALGENQLRPSVHFLRPALAAQRVTGCVRAPGTIRCSLTDHTQPGPVIRALFPGEVVNMKYDCLLWSHLSWHFFLLIVWNIDVVWWMNLTDGWCENNFNKQSQWCHNGKLIQTPDKCPSRLRQARGVGVKVWKFVPVSSECDQWSPQCVSPLSSQSVLTELNTGGRLFIATKLSCHFQTPGTFHWKPLNNVGSDSSF